MIRQYFINNQPITLPLPTPPSLLLSLSVHDTTTTPGPCSEKSASPRDGRGHCQAPQAFRRGEHMGRVGFDPRICLPDMSGHPCLILRATSISLQVDPPNTGKA